MIKTPKHGQKVKRQLFENYNICGFWGEIRELTV